jgi:hypothetical protein
VPALRAPQATAVLRALPARGVSLLPPSLFLSPRLELTPSVDNHAEVVRQAAAATRKAVQHAEYLLAGPITTGGTAAPVRGATAWRELRAAVAASEARCAALRADIAATRGEIKEGA